MDPDSGYLGLLSFALPNQLRPGTDLMSRLLFADKNIINIVVTTVIGEQAKDCYYSSPTQWSNNSISDVLYLPQTDDLPPIVIEIQHTVDIDFYLRLISYGTSAARQYRTPPILITFVISSIKYEVRKRTIPQTAQPFLWQIQHCQPWARSCYFVTIDSITQNLKEKPLNPFVGLSFFLISQCRSLAANPYCFDPTIQQLYIIAKKIFEDQATEGQVQITEDLMYVCDETKKKLEDAMVVLDQNEVPEIVKMQVAKCIEGAILITDAYRTKYEVSGSLSTLSKSRSSSPTSEIPSSSVDVPAPPNSQIVQVYDPTLQVHNPPIQVPAPTQAQVVRGHSRNWEYVNSRLSALGEKESIPWEAIYVDGRRNGYFRTLGSSNSLRASYSRWKKNELK